VLVLIETNPGLKQSELARAVHLDRSTVVSIVDNLERRRLVERRAAANDRRSNALSLTPTGAALLRRLKQRVDRHEKRLTRALDPPSAHAGRAAGAHLPRAPVATLNWKQAVDAGYARDAWTAAGGRGREYCLTSNNRQSFANMRAWRAGKQRAKEENPGANKPIEVEARGSVQAAFRVNGEELEASFAPYKTLLEVLREDLGLTGTKHGCELGECGACAVLVDGKPVLSCLMLAVECVGARSRPSKVSLTVRVASLQAAFADLGGAQCGYCTPGILMTAKALLDHEPKPSRQRIKEALSGNLCRCTGYLQIYESVEEAARRMCDGSACGGAQPSAKGVQS
jgi:carbon-monoxide dehydrogenase small subunit